MATIQISNLHPAGSELLFDSESYLAELTDDEIYSLKGGWTWSYTLTYKVSQATPAVSRTAYNASYWVSYEIGKRLP